MKKLKNFINRNKRVKGFTLVEMVIVIAIIAMLILLIVPGLSRQKKELLVKLMKLYVRLLRLKDSWLKIMGMEHH